MSLIDCFLLGLPAKHETRASVDQQCGLPRGGGRRRLAPSTARKLAGRNTICSRSRPGNGSRTRPRRRARLFMITDREILRRQNLLRDEQAN